MTAKSETLNEVRQNLEAWEIALAEYAELREEIGRLEEMGECSCDPSEFHTCNLCSETSVLDQRARFLMSIWGDTWAMRLRERLVIPYQPNFEKWLEEHPPRMLHHCPSEARSYMGWGACHLKAAYSAGMREISRRGKKKE